MNALSIIGLLADVAGLGALLFTAFVFWRARRQFAQELARLTRQYSATPVALAIGIGQDISGAVSHHVQASDMPAMPIKSYTKRGMVPAEEFHRVLQELLKIKQELTEAGATEVHLFYMGPVTLALGVGAVFDNWVPVKVYKYAGGGYEMDFVLHKESVLGLLNISSETAAEMIS